MVLMMKNKITINTFSRFWCKFHYMNRVNPANKTATRVIWDNINCIGRKANIIDNIPRGIKLSAYEYIKQQKWTIINSATTPNAQKG